MGFSQEGLYASLFEKIERVIVSALLIMMVITVFLATVEVGWLLIKDMISEPMFLSR